MAIQELLAERKRHVDWYCNANNIPTEAIRVLKLSQLAEEYPQEVSRHTQLLEDLRKTGFLDIVRELTSVEVPALDDKQGGLLLLGEPEAQYKARVRDYRWGVYIEGLALTEYGWGSHLLRMHILRVLVNEDKPILGELKVTVEYHRDGFLTFFNQGGPGNDSTVPVSSGRRKFEEMLVNTLTNSETISQQVVQFTDSGELLLINPVKPVTVQRFR